MYQKDKYKFSSNTSLILMGKNVTEERGLQSIEFNEELSEYGILMKDLIAVDFDDSVRNEILNISIYISENAELYGEMEEKKELPISKLSKSVLITKKCLEEWKDLIIAYSLIVGSYRYKHLNDYLRVIENIEDEKDDKKVIHLKDIVSFDNQIEEQKEFIKDEKIEEEENEQTKGNKIDDKNIRGIIVSKNRKTAIIMTSNGLFKKVSINKQSVCGEEVTGKIRKRLKDHKNILMGLSAVLMGLIIFITYLYTNIVSTIVIEAGASVRLEINSLNRVVHVTSVTDEGDEIIKETDVKDKDIDNAICKIIKYSIDNKKVGVTDTVTITVSGEAIKYGVLEKTGKYVDQEKIEVKFNNAGYQKKFY